MRRRKAPRSGARPGIGIVLALLLAAASSRCGGTAPDAGADDPASPLDVVETADATDVPAASDGARETPGPDASTDAIDTHTPADGIVQDVTSDAPPTDMGGDAPVADAIAATSADCLNRTHGEAECKDCCDCMGAACQEIVACRDACPLHDFGGNGDFIQVSAPSTKGPTGDYTACTALATEQAFKACCDCDGLFACGDQKYCRNACAGTSQWPPLTMGHIGSPVAIPGTFQFTEGPAWDAARGVLLFSDVDADTIFELQPPSTVKPFRTPSHHANGLGFDRDGLLLAAEQASRTLTRTATDGTVTAIAGAWDGKPLNSPNDLVVRTDGTIYFTDPTYGLGSTPSDLGFTGLYRIDTAGALHLEAVVDGQPNGVALAPDEKTLYVAATTANRILSFAVATDGTLSGQATFADVEAPDGFAVDQAGNLYVAAYPAGQGAIVVLTSAAKALGSIPLGQQPTNCGFGGADGKTLYVTARTALYRVAVPIPGF